ncbi:hypothetical protein CBM2598_U30106 [Cupriavidus taiwanensis]|nr:hypothetical protein CBM2598_U30106 [Cupriavidus taiwanensis]
MVAPYSTSALWVLPAGGVLRGRLSQEINNATEGIHRHRQQAAYPRDAQRGRDGSQGRPVGSAIL